MTECSSIISCVSAVDASMQSLTIATLLAVAVAIAFVIRHWKVQP